MIVFFILYRYRQDCFVLASCPAGYGKLMAMFAVETTSIQECQSLDKTLDMCRMMGYDYKTTFPNSFGANNLTAARYNMMQIHMDLVGQAQCHGPESLDISLLMCLLVYPICEDGGVQVPPCQSFCNDVTSNCNITNIAGQDPSSICGSLPDYPQKCFPKGYGGQESGGPCETVKFPMCQINGFTQTSFPNWMNDQSQDDALQSLAMIMFHENNQSQSESPHGDAHQEPPPGAGTPDNYTHSQDYGPGPGPGNNMSMPEMPEMSMDPARMYFFSCSLFFPKCNEQGGKMPICRSFCLEMLEKHNITDVPGKTINMEQLCMSFPDHNCLRPGPSQEISQETISMITEASKKFTRHIELKLKPSRQHFKYLLTENDRMQYFSTLPITLKASFEYLVGNNRVQLEKFEVHELKQFLTTLWRMRQEDIQLFLALDGNTIKTVNFDTLPTSIIELVVMYKPSVVHEIGDGLTDEQIEQFCPRLLNNKRLNKRYMEYILGNIPKCNIFIMQHTDEMRSHMSHEQASIIMHNIRTVSTPETWTLDILKTAPKAIKVEDIKRMNVSQFSNIASLGSVINKIPKKVRRAAMKKLKQAQGNKAAENWNKDMFKTMATMFPEDLKTKDIRAVPNAVIVDTLKSIPKDMVKNSRLANNIQRKIISHLQDTNTNIETLPPANVTDMLPYLVKNKKIFKKLTPTQLAENLETLKEVPLKKSEKRSILKKLGNQVNYTAVGNLVEALKPKEFQEIPVENLIKMVPNLKNMHLSKGQVKAIRKKMGNSFPRVADMTPENIEEYGSLLSAFDGKELANLPDSVITSKLSTLKDIDMDKSKFRRIVKKLKSAENATIGSTFKQLGKYAATSVPRKWLEQGSFQDLGLEDGLDVDTSPAQSSTIFDIVKRELGIPGPDNTNYTGSRMEGFGTMGVLGPNLTDFGNLILGDDGLAIAAAAFERDDIIPDVKAKLIVKMVRNVLNLTGSVNTIAEFGEEIWSEISRLLQFFDWKNDFPKIHQNDKEHICMAIQDLGDSAQNKLILPEVQKITDIAFECLKENSVIPNVLNETHMELIPGSLKCGLTKEEIQHLSADAIMMSLPDLEKCPFFDHETSRQILDTAINKISGIFTDSDLLGLLGSFVIHLTDNEMQQIDKEAFANVLISVMDKINSKNQMQAIRKKMGVGKKAAEIIKEHEYLRKFSLYAIDVITSVTTSSRKRRSTESLTCDEIDSLKPVLSSLSVDKLSSIEVVEFMTCLETLGSVSDWNADQLSTLASKAKHNDALGSISTWTEDDMIMAGSITAGLSAEEISQLQIDSEDILLAMGKYDLFTSEQLTAGFERWLSLSKSNDIGQVTSEELLALENFVCGISSDKINGISSATIVDSLSAFRDRSSCNSDQMQALANKVKESYGTNTATWQPSIITDMGVIIGGLDTTSISLFNIDQIGEIAPTSIENMPPSSFVGFTPEQLAIFSINQLRAVTEQQYNALSDNQRNVMKTTLGSDVPVVSFGTKLDPTKTLLSVLLLLSFSLLLG